MGGGPVAARKVAGLCQAGAEVFVNSPQIAPSLRVLADKKAITWIDNKYSPTRLKGMRLVIAATSNADVNHAVFMDAEKRGLFANVVDDLDYCRFVAPARYSSGSLEIAVTTGGAAPVIAKIVRDDIGDSIGKRFAPVVSLLGKRRSAIKRLSAEAKKTFWQRVATMVKTTKPGEDISLKKLDALLADRAGGSA